MDNKITLNGYILSRIGSDVQSMLDDTGCSLDEAVVVLRDFDDHLNVTICRVCVPGPQD